MCVCGLCACACVCGLCVCVFDAAALASQMHHLGSLVTLRDAVSLVHALAEQTRLNRTAMIAPLKQMQREAYQAEQNIRNWQPSHRNYVKKENMLAGEVQTLFANTYREEVAPALVAVVQGEMGGLLQSVWTNVMCSVGECRVSTSPGATTVIHIYVSRQYKPIGYYQYVYTCRRHMYVQ